MRLLYIFEAALIALLVFLALTLGSAIPLCVTIVSSSPSVGDAFRLVAQLLLLAFADQSAAIFALNAATSILIGINAALLTFFWRKNKTRGARFGIAGGVAGSIATLLGFGCAACGTVFVSLLLTTLGAGSLSTFPLFSGNYLQYIGLALLAVSTLWLYRETRKPAVCET
jgi:hypothetical protein